MHLAILGATGATGRLLVDAALRLGHTVQALCRHEDAFVSTDGLSIVLGDAMDLAAVRRTVRGAEAVISLLGPTRGAPADFARQSTAILVRALEREGVSRLVVVTGAMSGPREHLGWFYRWLTGRAAIKALVDDRREADRLLTKSRLDWTIVRPPRLSNSGVSAQVEVSDAMHIRMLDSIPRAALAEVLLRTATSGEASRRAVYVRAPRSGPVGWLIRWGGEELSLSG